MTREEKLAILKDIIDGEIVHPQVRKDVGAWAINELKQEPCADTISRQYLLDNCVVDKVTMPFVPVIKIKSAPPVISQPKMGKWLIEDDCERFIAKCSECGRVEDSRMINNYPYCHCGAKMESEDE